jgi:hypothetical protein
VEHNVGFLQAAMAKSFLGRLGYLEDMSKDFALMKDL